MSRTNNTVCNFYLAPCSCFSANKLSICLYIVSYTCMYLKSTDVLNHFVNLDDYYSVTQFSVVVMKYLCSCLTVPIYVDLGRCDDHT